MARDYYDALGVSQDASQDEIKRAFREKAQEYHPDASDHDDAEERFKEIQEAYEVLGEEESREAYDSMGHRQFTQARKQGFDPSDGGGGPFGGAGGAGGPFGGMGGGQGGFGDFQDIFENLFGGMGGGGGRGEDRGRRVATSVRITLEEAFEGVEREIRYQADVDCEDCGGSGAAEGSDVSTCGTCGGQGRVQAQQRTPFGQATTVRECPDCGGDGKRIEDPCPSCRGEGTVRETVTRAIEVPEGVEDGTTLRLQDGDVEVLIEVHVEDHDVFERDGADLYYVQPVSFPQAVFGDEVTVPTIDGEVAMEVPSSTQGGERFRLQGKGMPRMQRRGRGDQLVTVEVVTPEPGDLGDDEREALEAFAAAGGDEIDVEDGLIDRIKRGVFS